MVLIIITIILQVVILLAVLHAFKVRKQRGITWASPVRKWYFVVSAVAQAVLAVIAFIKTDDCNFWLLLVIVSILSCINLSAQVTADKSD